MTINEKAEHEADPRTCPTCMCTRNTDYDADGREVYWCSTQSCCLHENTYIDRKSMSPDAHYDYVCEDCGAIGYPDGPADDEGSAEAIDWQTA